MIAGNGKSLEPETPQEADVRDLRSVITGALSATPVNEQSLRRGVWTIVGLERQAGTSPGLVIMALTEVVDASPIPAPDRQRVMQRVILWCVEAYFGHLGGDSVTTATHAQAPLSSAAP